MKNLNLCAAAALLALASSAQAQSGKPTSVYLNLSGGGSSYDIDCAGTVSCDNAGSAVRLLGGYRLGSGFGAEAIYLGLGQSSAVVNLSGTGLVAVKLKSSLVGGGLAVYLPFGNSFEAAARLGLGSVTTKVSGGLGSTVVVVESERKVKPYFGLSLSYAFTQSLALDLSWDSTQFEALNDKANVSAFAVGLSLRF